MVVLRMDISMVVRWRSRVGDSPEGEAPSISSSREKASRVSKWTRQPDLSGAMV